MEKKVMFCKLINQGNPDLGQMNWGDLLFITPAQLASGQTNKGLFTDTLLCNEKFYTQGEVSNPYINVCAKRNSSSAA